MDGETHTASPAPPHEGEADATLDAVFADLPRLNAYLADKNVAVVPIDLVTHLCDFKTACEIALASALIPTEDQNDALYWQHQIDTIAAIQINLLHAKASEV